MKSSNRPTNRVDTLVHRLAADIQGDEIGHGTWLKQFDLADRYEVNRLTVRSALDKLVARGLVEHFPNRGYKVRSPDQTERRELLEIRTTLETSAAKNIIANATPADIVELSLLAERFSSTVSETGDFLALVDANLLFHRRLLAINSNRQIPILIDEIRTRMASGQNRKWKSIARLNQSALEHHEMVDAVRAGKVETLMKLMEQHIMSS